MRDSKQPLGPLARVIQLVVLMLFGAGVGLLCVPILVQALYLYDHGRGETERVMLMTAVLGALLGACLHAVIQRAAP